jgi:hypothetical protein
MPQYLGCKVSNLGYLKKKKKGFPLFLFLSLLNIGRIFNDAAFINS